jgi:hypothetical protein
MYRQVKGVAVERWRACTGEGEPLWEDGDQRTGGYRTSAG